MQIMRPLCWEPKSKRQDGEGSGRSVPELQGALLRDVAKIVVGRKHREVVSETKLREERIDRSGLDASAPAAIAQGGGFDVIRAIRHNERDRGEAIQYLRPCLRAQETLQELLENEACSENYLVSLDGPDKRLHLTRRRRRLAPKGERPDAGIDEQAHLRLRSAL